jgi:hypothetical protein
VVDTRHQLSHASPFSFGAHRGGYAARMAPRRPPRKSEAERYRVAAEETLNQLDWVIDYLHRIKKDRIAAALKHNRDSIAARLM